MRRFTLVVILFTALIPCGVKAAPLSVTETHINNTCYGQSNGSIDITPTGGTTPYTYLWTGSITTQDLSGLVAGAYSVVVTDNIGSTVGLTVNITEPSAISVTKNITPVFCGGDSTGAVDLTVSGGTPGYTYLWNDGVTTQDRINVTAANRYFTITDANGCTKFDSANVTQPPGMVISTTTTDQTCSGSNGAIDLTVQYGIPGYNYMWNDGATTQDRTGISSGTYTVTITDNSTCTVSASVSVGLTVSGMSINSTSVQPSCFSGNDGSITITTVVGSTGPFTFEWGDGPTTQNRTGLSAGTYIVTATSSTSCTATTSINIGQPTSISVSLTSVPVSCNGGSNGVINTTRSGGTAPYSYAWSDGGFTQNRTGLATGNYTLTVTDFKGCTATATIFVAQPLLALSVTTIPSPLACIGGPSGSVFSTVVGGTGPYTYWWGGGIFSQNRINVASGTYCVTATDANGCTANACGVIPPYTPLNVSVTHTDVNCTNDSTGSIDLTVTNGSTPYSYLWTNGSTSQDLINLGPGTYTVVVLDNNACTVSKTAIISQPSFPVSVNTTVANISCHGKDDGSIALSVMNGTSPYTYDWGGMITTQNRTGLSSGNYSVTVTDNNGCSISTGATITEPTQLIVSASATDVACYGDSSGTVSLTASGSFAPYAYNWNDGGSTQNRNNIPAGNYNVLLTDNHGCTASASATVSQPVSPVAITYTKGDVSCSGGNTGWININVVGGTSPYTYDWGMATTQNVSNLSAGTYTVTVLDNAGCSSTSSSTINQTSSIVISSSITNVACSGASNGTITLTVSGGTSPYTFDWGGVNTQNRTNLASGFYTVTVTDSLGCINTHTDTVLQSTSLTASAVASNVSCNGGSNGTISVTVNGGALPYGFVWNDGPITQNRNSVSAGNYAVTVTDANSCSAVALSVVAEPSAISGSVLVVNPGCFGSSNGSIDLTVNGGTGIYTYLWSSGETSEDVTNKSAGNYSVSITDANSCTASTSATVTNPTPIALSTTQVNISCSGAGTGSIDLSVSGGTSPFTYNWSNAETTEDISLLAVGNYSVTVKDNNLCSATISTNITQPAFLVLNETHTNISCNGMGNGSIDINVGGGAAPYTYDWGGVFTPSRTGLSAGTYSVSVTDNGGCSASTSVSITEPAPISLIINTTDAACYGANGSVDLTVSGGTPNYSYFWDNGSINQNLAAVPSGNYSVVVNDANSCTASATTIVNEPTAIQITLSKVDIICFGSSNGSISSTVNGGTGAYIYQWSNMQSSQNISGLSSGNYILTITDAASCVATASETINEPAAITITETHTNVSCNGANNGSIITTITGGAGSLTFLWSNSSVTQNISNLSSNIYKITVTDANACSATGSVLITQPSAIVLTETHTPYACSNKAGTIDLTVNGGTSPYNYNWSNGAVMEDVNNLSAGNYSVTVADANSCSASTAISITAITPLTTSFTKTDVVCNGANTGAIDLSVNGGSMPYSYQWTNSAVTQDLSGIAAGNYSVMVTDANHCSSANTTTIVQPDPLQISDTVISVRCYGDNTGVIHVAVTGGFIPYTFAWNNSLSASDISSLRAGNYSVTITDANGCSAAANNIIVTEPARMNVTANSVPVSCTGYSNGEINLQVTGGTIPYAYHWSNQETTDGISNLSNGNYSVTVTDTKGCTATATENIGTMPDMVLSSTVKNTACEQSQTGRINIDVSGGTPNYIYSWSNGSNSQNASNLSPGNYEVTITDSRNCSVQRSFNISSDYSLSLDVASVDAINVGESTQLTATTNVDYGNTYSWSPAYDLSCATCATTLATPATTTHYTVSIVDTNGCKASGELDLTVKSITDIFIPNAFTPNHDGNNDLLEIYGDKASITFLDFSLFNRWGEKVFESSDPNFAWDGTYKGEPSPPGVYVYVMKVVFINGNSRDDFKGSITVLR